MAKKEYFVTKLSFKEDEKRIKDVFAYEYDGETLSAGETRQRQWMVNRTNEGADISILTPNPDKKDKWVKGKTFTYTNDCYSWGSTLPENITKRKTFVSYYHKDDQAYREKFENVFGDLVVSKSVEKDDIDSDNSDEYIKQLIQKEYLSDTTVLVVLVGPKTKCRKHVDWEIAGALNLKVGDSYAGVIGILLPGHPDYGSDKYHAANLPERLAANVKSGYAILRDWTDDRVKMQELLEKAFSKRGESEKIVNKSIPQMDEDTCK
ncbi:MAG: TIR domain-containing protein [Chitinophagales bacterium]